MSFFKDFKDDLSLAVNELLPGEDFESEEDMEESPEMMVNTLEGELDIETELSKLDGLLEHVDDSEKVKHVQIEPEEPVLEKLPELESEPMAVPKPASKPQPMPKASVQPKPQPAPKASAQPKPQPMPKAPVQSKSQPVSKTSVQSKPQPAPKASVQPKPQPVQKAPVQPKSQTVSKASVQPKKQESMDTILNSFYGLRDLEKENEEDFRFSLDLLAEEPKSQPRSQLHAKFATDPVIKSAFHNNKNMKTSTTIKEEIPMNDEMTKETTTLAMDEELSVESPEITDEVSIITTGTTIKGNLSTTGSFSISGRVEGNVQCNGKLEVTGTIKGNSSSSEVFSDAAKIEGEIMSTGTVKIGLGSVVVGNIAATSAVIAGAVKGDIDVQGPVVVDTSAVIVGNIKSRSVQINNGAVIEGFCSQCYADIDVESLFGENKKGK